MKELDYRGLELCEFQAKLFEASYDLNCSSKIFLRRFYYSNLLKSMDSENAFNISLEVNDGLNSLINQFGEFSYGKDKYPKASLYWIGYMYRYIAYTREESTRFIMSLLPPDLLNRNYYAFHTQSPEWCVRSLLEIINQEEWILDKNMRLKYLIKENMQKEIAKNKNIVNK